MVVIFTIILLILLFVESKGYFSCKKKVSLYDNALNLVSYDTVGSDIYNALSCELDILKTEYKVKIATIIFLGIAAIVSLILL